MVEIPRIWHEATHGFTSTFGSPKIVSSQLHIRSSGRNNVERLCRVALTVMAKTSDQGEDRAGHGCEHRSVITTVRIVIHYDRIHIV